MDRLEGILRSKKGEYALILLFFLLVAVIFTWPLVRYFHTRVLGGAGDPLLNTWIISWDAKTIFTAPSHLFQGNILFPSRDVGAYSEIAVTLGLLAAPFLYIFRNPILAYNILLLFGMVFSAFGCYLLIKELTGSRWGGLAGGLFFAFCPYKISKLPHLQILFSAFLPFMMLYLFRYLKKGGRKNLILFALFFLLQSLVSWHYLIFCSLATGLLLVWKAFSSRTRSDWSRLAWVIAAVLIVGICLIPFALPYLRVHQRLPYFERSLFETKLYSAEFVDYLRVHPYNLIYADMPYPFQAGAIGSESVLYPGIVAVILALAGLLLRRRRDGDPYVFEKSTYRNGALYFLALTVLSVILTFGPEIRGMNNLVYRIPYKLGLFRFIRVPTRFYILVALGLAVLAGYGVAKIATRLGNSLPWKKSGMITAVALLLMVSVELASFNHLMSHEVPVWGGVPEVYSWLEQQGDVETIELPTWTLDSAQRYDRYLELIAEVPFEYLQREGYIMYYSTYHWKKIVNGYSGYHPFTYNRIMTEMQGFPSPRSVDLLRGLGIDYVIWHWDWVPQDRLEEYRARFESTPGLSLAGDFGVESVFGVMPGGTATPSDLRAQAVTPDMIKTGMEFNLGIAVTNSAGQPFVLAEEEPQLLTLTFEDASGGVAYEEEGEYRAPFFLEPGETQILPYRSRGAPAEGDYSMRVSLEGGVLGEAEFLLPVRVREIPDSISEGDSLAGRVYYPGREALSISTPDGLYPLVLEVENSGQTLWIAAKETREDDLIEPKGLVRLGVIWTKDGEIVWEEQRCTLPCDVSPGQRVQVPSLVRPPAVAGSYLVRVGLLREGGYWFGEPVEFEVEIATWKKAEETPQAARAVR